MDFTCWLRLTLAPELSNAAQLTLLQAFGTPARVFAAPYNELVAAVGEKIAQATRVEASAAEIGVAIKWLQQPGCHLVVVGEDRYPRALMQMADPPAALYVQGRVDFLNAPCFAVVGSRNASVQGTRDAESFAHSLSSAGLTIVSGMALGIDTAAHRGGLRGRGSSLAVMGTGANRVYPPRNKDLAHRLAAEGALVSEFPLDTRPLRGNFPRRNRLISGLSRGVLVVEAALGSGSLITTRFAGEQNRDVFAIPGSIHSPMSKGCHKLIKEGAKLVECAEDILEELHIGDHPASPNVPHGNEPEDEFLDAMGGAPVSIDEMANRTGASAASIAARITALQMEGRIASIAGGLFQRLSEP